jgi:hypothetical protein
MKAEEMQVGMRIILVNEEVKRNISYWLGKQAIITSLNTAGFSKECCNLLFDDGHTQNFHCDYLTEIPQKGDLVQLKDEAYPKHTERSGSVWSVNYINEEVRVIIQSTMYSNFTCKLDELDFVNLTRGWDSALYDWLGKINE